MATSNTYYSYDNSDLPICAVCDVVSLECQALPGCGHPACPKCCAIAALTSGLNNISVCSMCLEEKDLHGNSTSEPTHTPEVSNKVTNKNDISLEDELQASLRKDHHDKDIIEFNSTKRSPRTTSNQNKNDSRSKSTLGQDHILTSNKVSSPLEECVIRIQKAISEATKTSHCRQCLSVKKCSAPDLLCLDCALSFCQRYVYINVIIDFHGKL